MQSLKNLRSYLLAELDIEEDDFSVMTQDIKVLSYCGRKDDSNHNDFFHISFSANIIFLNCNLPPAYIIHKINRWMENNHPGHPPDSLAGEAEILSHDSFDLMFTVSNLKDTYKPVVNDQGTELIYTPNVGADPIIRADGIVKLIGQTP